MGTLTLLDFINHIQVSYLKNEVLENLENNYLPKPVHFSVRESSAQCVLDTILNLFDASSSLEDNVMRINAGLESAVLQIEQMRREILGLAAVA